MNSPRHRTPVRVRKLAEDAEFRDFAAPAAKTLGRAWKDGPRKGGLWSLFPENVKPADVTSLFLWVLEGIIAQMCPAHSGLS